MVGNHARLRHCKLGKQCFQHLIALEIIPGRADQTRFECRLLGRIEQNKLVSLVNNDVDGYIFRQPERTQFCEVGDKWHRFRNVWKTIDSDEILIMNVDQGNDTQAIYQISQT